MWYKKREERRPYSHLLSNLTPKSSGVGRGVSQRKSSACVEVTPTQQHKAGYKNFIFKSLSNTPFEKADKRSQKAFQCLQWTLANSAKFFNRFDAVWFSCSLSSITRLNEHWPKRLFPVVSDWFIPLWWFDRLVKRQRELISSLTMTATGSFFLPPPQSLKFRPRATRKQKSNQNRAALLHSRVPWPVEFIWVVFFISDDKHQKGTIN